MSVSWDSSRSVDGYQASDVAAVVCTMNSISGIERCLASLRDAGVGQIIVVDARSFDGTREIAEDLADLVLEDEGEGLGKARNLGIARTTAGLVLNFGSDNVMPQGELEKMIETLVGGGYHGVSAQTRVEGDNYPSRGLNAWRRGRFRPGPIDVIGTPTLFRGNMLRSYSFDTARTFSDDSELCERWSQEFGSRFAISTAEVLEIGKASWSEVRVRSRMYGISDEEIYRIGSSQGWNTLRKIRSLLHPLSADLLTPIAQLPAKEAVSAVPFLMAFTAMRYEQWIRTAWDQR